MQFVSSIFCCMQPYCTHCKTNCRDFITCKIGPAKTCLEYVESMIITKVLSVEEETVIVHCCYCTFGATSSTPTTQTELLDMDIAKTRLQSISSINSIYQHPVFNFSDFRHCYFLSVPIKQFKHILLEQVFDLTDKSVSYLIGWSGRNWKGQLQQVERNRAVL